MPISGKYDFPGIKKTGAVGLKAALASTGWGAWILRSGKLGDLILEFIVNWLLNKGLIVLNIAAIEIGGEIDQKSFDSAMDDALAKITAANGTLTPEQKKEIDDGVIEAFRKFAPIGKPAKSSVVRNDEGAGLPS
jgi:hypothetical protein